jgi:hypothetical protein
LRYEREGEREGEREESESEGGEERKRARELDILGVLYRKGALLPFLKEVMPMAWDSKREQEG